MIKRIDISLKLINSIDNYLKSNNLGNRGFEDGNKRKQLVGLLGECVTIKYLTGKYPNLRERSAGFDGGYDIELFGKKIDVKCMERNSFVKEHYVNNFYILQEKYNSDIVIFSSFNSGKMVLEICGWIPKSTLKEKGIFYKSGTKRIREDGSCFNFRQDNYEVENKDLEDIDSLLDYLKSLTN